MCGTHDQEPDEHFSIEAVLETLANAKATLDERGLAAAAQHVAAALAAIDELR
jgi:hypothetical protein